MKKKQLLWRLPLGFDIVLGRVFFVFIFLYRDIRLQTFWKWYSNHCKRDGYQQQLLSFDGVLVLSHTNNF